MSGKWKKWRGVLLLGVALFLVVALVSPAFASETYVVHLLVAYDEEFAWTASWVYGYSAQEFAYLMVWCTGCFFSSNLNVEFRVVQYSSWDSDDAVTNPDVMLAEVVSETGFYSGMIINYKTVDVLVAFSDQHTVEVYGKANRAVGAVLVMEIYPDGVGQATDNVLQHELSHLYNATDELTPSHDCVMNYYKYWIDFPYYYYVPTALVTNSWCSSQMETMMSNRTFWGQPASILGGACGGGLWWLRRLAVAW